MIQANGDAPAGRASEVDVDVLVVGAGPTGLTMAAELAARGAVCRVVDRLPEPSERSRALAVQARTLELFERMGVARELIGRGQRIRRLNAVVEGRRAVDLEFGDIGVDDTAFPFVLFVSQAETEHVLAERLARVGPSVERGVELLDFREDGEGVVARLGHGEGREEAVRARYIVGCDGAHSAVRKGAGLSFHGAPYPQEFVLADLRVEWSGGHDRLHAFLSRRGVLVVFPLAGEGEYRLIASRPGRGGDEAADPTLEEFEAIAAAVSPYEMALSRPSWLARFHLHHRAVDRYRAGRAFVAGDAAHIHSPAGGQGMNTGIQDAYNLAWKLALVLDGRAPEGLLDSYHAERYPVGRRLLRTTDRFFQAATAWNPVTVRLRNFLFPRVAPFVLRTRARRARALCFISQLGIKYPRSPIVAEVLDGADRAFAQGPAAGERAPDGPLRRSADADGLSLLSRLTGEGHHLLLFAGPGTDAISREGVEEAARVLAHEFGDLMEVKVIVGGAGGTHGSEPGACLDLSGELHRRYGLTGPGCYLVRPDGHIAFRSPGTDLTALASYLRRTFHVRAPAEAPVASDLPAPS